MRTIGVVTTSRADYGIYLPLLRRLREDPGMDLRLFVTGMHLAPGFGQTVKTIETDGFTIQDRVDMLLASDTPEGISKSMGLGVLGFAQTYSRWKPDILVVLGDRFEMHAAALAALPFRIPVAHIHGGELTFGAIDDSLRHSMTKLSHLHFVATEEYAHRIVQLGEEPWRITVCGGLSLDNLKELDLMPLEELSSFCGEKLENPFLLVTFHPVTMEYDRSGEQVEQLLKALRQVEFQTLITMPNADTGNQIIRRRIESFCSQNFSAHAVENLGTRGYFSAMFHASAMVGNSSSGIVEAASFKLPVVNVGTRQGGRARNSNIIDVGYTSEEILEGIRKSQDPAFRESLNNLRNVYERGSASGSITKRLRETPLDDRILLKRFHDL